MVMLTGGLEWAPEAMRPALERSTFYPNGIVIIADEEWASDGQRGVALDRPGNGRPIVALQTIMEQPAKVAVDFDLTPDDQKRLGTFYGFVGDVLVQVDTLALFQALFPDGEWAVSDVHSFVMRRVAGRVRAFTFGMVI